MTIMKITLNLAFTDAERRMLDSVLDSLKNYAVDGLNADVAFTSNAIEIPVSIPDPDFDADDSDIQIQDWDDRARSELA